MMTRKVKIYSTVGASGTIETDVTTLGELKPLLRLREINYEGMKMLVGETRNELGVDEAVLPEGDFKLYLMPEKTKSGGKKADALNRLADIFAEAQQICEELADTIDEECSDSVVSSVKSNGAVSFEDIEALEDIRRLAGRS